MALANTVTYQNTATIMAVKSFTIEAHTFNIGKLFFLLCHWLSGKIS